MKIVITGGLGFIGSNFCRYLLKTYKNYKIYNFDKISYAGNKDNLKDVEESFNYKFHRLDICDYKKLEFLIKKIKPDCIINFAAETHVDRSIMEPDLFVRTDVLGTFNVLEVVRNYNISRMIQVSTDEVYGSIEKGSFTEKSKLSPTSPYSASKASADLLVKSYVKTYSVPSIIVRPTNNYGPYQFPEKLIPLMITNAIEGKYLPVYGDGKNVRDWLYVLDTVVAIDIVLHKGKIGEVYNISSGNEKENIVVVKKILELLDKPFSMVKFVKDRLAHDFRYSVDSSKIYKLGFYPKYDFDYGLKLTVDWYLKNISWWKKIKYKKSFRDFYNKQYFCLKEQKFK